MDAPCGDCFWISKINLDIENYIGADIVAKLIEKNKKKYPQFTFYKLDIINDPLPKADVILCRDCLVHLTIKQIKTTLHNFKKSGARFLLTTTFTRNRKNNDIRTGDWRPLNFQMAPFNFPEPLEIIKENNTQGGKKFADKSLALWQIADLPF